MNPQKVDALLEAKDTQGVIEYLTELGYHNIVLDYIREGSEQELAHRLCVVLAMDSDITYLRQQEGQRKALDKKLERKQQYLDFIILNKYQDKSAAFIYQRFAREKPTSRNPSEATWGRYKLQCK